MREAIFQTRLFAKLMGIYGIRHVIGLSYHPQSNGQAEISNWEIKKILEKIVNGSRKGWHDQKILRREFKAVELVLLYYSKLKLFPGKLKSRWSGSYTVVASIPFGAVTLKTDYGDEFKVNGQRLKHYLGGNINED